jgi:hypothetical protein
MKYGFSVIIGLNHQDNENQSVAMPAELEAPL